MSFGDGGSGSGSIAGSSDVALSSPSDGQVLAYNSTDAKWENQTINTGTTPGEVALDSFSGANDDAKLAAAMSYASAQAYPPVIRLSNRSYTFTQSIGQPYDSFALRGPSDSWQSSASSKVHCTVNLDIAASGTDPAGYWINVTNGKLWNMCIADIYFVGNSHTQFLRAPGSGNLLWACTLHSLQFNNFRSVLGNSSEALATNLIIIDGYWSIQQCTDTAVALRGSDNRKVFGDGCNIDSSQPANGKYHVMFTYLSNNVVGPMYLNCAEGGWRGLFIDGNATNGHALIVTGAIIEGRNPTDPCIGQLVHIQGGQPTLRDCLIDCGMSSPGSDDYGLICVSGSSTMAVIDGCNFAHAAGVDPATVPCVYADGATVRVSNAIPTQRDGGPAWNGGLPLVQSVNAASVHADDSVTVT